MRLSASLVLVLLLAMPPVAGCGPAVPPEDLGTVLEEVPEIPDSNEPAASPKSPPAAKPEAKTPQPPSEP
jgi:hypothetical protein